MMRSVSKTRAALERRLRPAEQEFKAMSPICWECGRRRAEGIHHIASGGSRAKAKECIETWMRLCHECHVRYHEHRCIARELAVKLIHDTEHFDRSKVLEIMGRADTAVTLREIVSYLEVRR